MFSFLLAFMGLSLWESLSLLVSYVSSRKAFPNPLQKEEEREYLQRMYRGDRCARDKLIEHNLRLVAHIAKKYENTGVDTDDLISIGSVGLIKGIKTFNPRKKARLATYAARCIENEILMYLRRIKKKKREVYLYQPIGSDKEGNEITLVDVLGTDGDIIAREVELSIEEETLYKKIHHLNKREAKVICMRYGLIDGQIKTQREIAKKLGISRSYVSRIEKKAVEKLSLEFEREGYGS